MSVYLTNDNEVEDFTMQYRTIFDKTSVSDPNRKISLPLKEGYVQQDIHSLIIRTDYGHKTMQSKIRHTNIELLDVFNNKINVNDDMSFIEQNFDIPSYERAIDYIFMQVEKCNTLIGPKYWISPFGVHENRLNFTKRLWQESGVSIPLCILSKNIYVKMIEKTYNQKIQILNKEFQQIVEDQIETAKMVETEDSDNIILHQLNSVEGIFLLPFPFFVPDESFRFGSLRYTEDGKKQLDSRFENMGLIFGKSNGDEKTLNYNPQDQSI
jgi:hypothetical protein